MKILDRFKLIGRLINNRTNIAAKQFADAKLDLQQKQNKLNELNLLASDYRKKLANSNIRMSATTLKQYHKFLDYLDFVIKKQNEVVMNTDFEVKKKRRFWIQCHKQNKGLKDYIVNLEESIVADQLKSEQKEQDTSVTDNFVYQAYSND